MKTKLLSTVLLLFITLVIKAQSDKIKIGLSTFPNYSMGIISNDGNAPEGVENNSREMGTWKPSISTNVFIAYSTKIKVTISVGLGYQNDGSRVEQSNLSSGDQIDPRKGFINNPSETGLEAVKINYTQHSIFLPIQLKYPIWKRVYTTIGASPSFRFSSTMKTCKYYSDGSKKTESEEDEFEDFRDFNIYGSFGIGVNFYNTEKLNLFIQPHFQYGFLGITKNTPLTRNTLSIGVLLGVEI